ncbi:MAG: aminoglycoside phosphotransferase family protein [Lachnospiraceae bacterium]|nr:aminoglycoside phosphotransferase family protein [Lachnospiraceae bacterium]
MREKLIQVCQAFRIGGEFQSYEEIKVGNVNHTYKVNFKQESGMEKSYMVQRVNTFVFKRPVEVMDNIDRVTEHIRAKKPGQVALHFHHTEDRKTYVFDESGFWRLFNYIESDNYNVTEDLTVIRNGGEAFGEFQMNLSDFAAEELYETIVDFHNTKKRYEKLKMDVAADPCGRVAEVRELVDWIFDVEEMACRLTDLYDQGLLPLRVTHNDTKINNVLFDKKSKEALVVIDLDTVMPGLVGHDFGDAIRFAANYVEEDSPETEKAGLNLAVFQAFTEGFLKQTAGALTEKEIETLPLSCFAITVELASRFLDDYILGDPYFKIRYPEHNLVRTRCQVALAKDMLGKMDQMEQIVKEAIKMYVL